MDEPKVIIDLPQPQIVELPSYDLVDAGLTQPLNPRHILTQAGPYPSIAPATLDVEPSSWRPPPPRTNGLPIVLAVMGVCGTLAAIAGVIGFHRWRDKQKEEAQYAQQIADDERRAAQRQSTQTIDPAPVDTAPDLTVDPTTMNLDAPRPKPVVTTPVVQPKTTPPAVQPKTTTTPVAKTTPKASGNGTGTLRTYSSAAGKAVFVDGKQVGVAPAPITVQCGPHQIRVGDGKTRSVNVPCLGAVTVGTPDGD